MRRTITTRLIALGLTSVITVISPFSSIAAAMESNSLMKPNYSQIFKVPASEKKDTAKGWKYENGSWFLYNKDGSKKTGWYKDTDGLWYYFNTASEGVEGSLHTGWLSQNGKTYFMNPKGFDDGTSPEYKNTAGAMDIGWVNVNNFDYYFNPDGTLDPDKEVRMRQERKKKKAVESGINDDDSEDPDEDAKNEEKRSIKKHDKTSSSSEIDEDDDEREDDEQKGHKKKDDKHKDVDQEEDEDSTPSEIKKAEINFGKKTKKHVVQSNINDDDITRYEWIAYLLDATENDKMEFDSDFQDYADIDLKTVDGKNVERAYQLGYLPLVSDADVEDFNGDEPATREFAAYTTAYAMAFDMDLSVAANTDDWCDDYDDLAFPKQDGVIVNGKYLELIGEEFLPDRQISEDDANQILSAVKTERYRIKHLGENQYAHIKYQDGVIYHELSKIKNYKLEIDDGIYTVELPRNANTRVIQEDSIFILFDKKTGEPKYALKATNIERDKDKLIVTAESPELEEVLKDFDFELTSNGIDPDGIQVAEGVTVEYTDNAGTQHTIGESESNTNDDIQDIEIESRMSRRNNIDSRILDFDFDSYAVASDSEINDYEQDETDETVTYYVIDNESLDLNSGDDEIDAREGFASDYLKESKWGGTIPASTIKFNLNGIKLDNSKVTLTGSLSITQPTITIAGEGGIFDLEEFTLAFKDKVKVDGGVRAKLSTTGEEYLRPTTAHELGRVTVGMIYGFEVYLVFYIILSAEGNLKVSCSVESSKGFTWRDGNLRWIKDANFDFNPLDIYGSLTGGAKLGLNVGLLGCDYVGLMIEGGYKINATVKTYFDEKPNMTCIDLKGSPYVDAGFNTDTFLYTLMMNAFRDASSLKDKGYVLVDIPVFHIIDEDNVPNKFKIKGHYENKGQGMKEVQKCTYGKGSISGKVVDAETQQGIKNAEITLCNDNKELKVSSDSDGEFKFTNLSEGEYTLKITAPRYKEYKADKVVVTKDKETRLPDIKMEENKAGVRVKFKKVASDYIVGDVECVFTKNGEDKVYKPEYDSKTHFYTFKTSEYGTYTMKAQKEGFKTITAEFQISENSKLQEVEYTMEAQQLTEHIVKIYSKNKDITIEDANVQLVNPTTGEQFKAQYDKDLKGYVIDLKKLKFDGADAKYTLTIEAKGHKTINSDFYEPKNSTTEIVMEPSQGSGPEIRVVLTSKDNMKLEQHLFIDEKDSGGTHTWVDQFKPEVSKGGQVLASMQEDETGADETVFLMLDDTKYSYYVYCNDTEIKADKFKALDLNVKVYRGDTLIDEFDAPDSTSGDVYHVFDYDTASNKLSSQHSEYPENVKYSTYTSDKNTIPRMKIDEEYMDFVLTFDSTQSTNLQMTIYVPDCWEASGRKYPLYEAIESSDAIDIGGNKKELRIENVNAGYLCTTSSVETRYEFDYDPNCKVPYYEIYIKDLNNENYDTKLSDLDMKLDVNSHNPYLKVRDLEIKGHAKGNTWLPLIYQPLNPVSFISPNNVYYEAVDENGPKEPLEGIRAILTWDGHADLRSEVHTTTTKKGGKKIITGTNGTNREYSTIGGPVVRTFKGNNVISTTFYKNDKYKSYLYIYNHTNAQGIDSTALYDSKPRIYVYKGTELVETIKPPKRPNKGNLWYVLRWGKDKDTDKHKYWVKNDIEIRRE